jgi:hypothetical protein
MTCGGSLWWNAMTHIDGSNAVATKRQLLSTLADPQHKNKWQYKELSDTLGWSTKIETMLTSAKAWSTLWDVAEFDGGLSASAASFVNRPSCVTCTTIVTIMKFNVKTRT